MEQEAIARLQEWAKHSEPVRRIAAYFRVMMTPFLAKIIMQEERDPESMWRYVMRRVSDVASLHGELPPDVEVHSFAIQYLVFGANLVADPLANPIFATLITPQHDATQGVADIRHDKSNS